MLLVMQTKNQNIVIFESWTSTMLGQAHKKPVTIVIDTKFLFILILFWNISKTKPFSIGTRKHFASVPSGDVSKIVTTSWENERVLVMFEHRIHITLNQYIISLQTTTLCLLSYPKCRAKAITGTNRTLHMEYTCSSDSHYRVLSGWNSWIYKISTQKTQPPICATKPILAVC